MVFYLIFLVIHISKFRNSQLVKQSDNVNMDNILDIKKLRINSMSTINSDDNHKREITESAVNDGGIQMLWSITSRICHYFSVQFFLECFWKRKERNLLKLKLIIMN